MSDAVPRGSDPEGASDFSGFFGGSPNPSTGVSVPAFGARPAGGSGGRGAGVVAFASVSRVGAGAAAGFVASSFALVSLATEDRSSFASAFFGGGSGGAAASTGGGSALAFFSTASVGDSDFGFSATSALGCSVTGALGGSGGGGGGS